jgi:membrane-bound lytic murein transglycosylase D
MPETARELGLRVDGEHDERFDPEKSTRGAVRLIKRLYSKYKNWMLVLIAYNWGEGNLDRTGPDRVLENMNLLPEETRNYVHKFFQMLKSPST